MELISCPPEILIHVLSNLRGDQIALCATVRSIALELPKGS
jgi:hypothetical protein